VKSPKKVNVITVVKKVSLICHWEDGDSTVYTVAKKNRGWLDFVTLQIVRENLHHFDKGEYPHNTFKSCLRDRDASDARDVWNIHHAEMGENCRMEIVESSVIKRVTPLKPFAVRDPKGKLLKHFDTIKELRAYLNQHPALKEMYNV